MKNEQSTNYKEPVLPKTICYGTITVPINSPLGEIESLICSIGIEKQFSDMPDFDTFSNKQLEENSDLTVDELNQRYDSEMETAKIHEDKMDELKEELTEKMKNFPQKDTLKKFMNERKQYYRQESNNPSVPFADRQDCHYQDIGTAEAQKEYARKVEKNKEQ